MKTKTIQINHQPRQMATSFVNSHLWAFKFIEFLANRRLILRCQPRPWLVGSPIVVLRLCHLDVVIEANNLLLLQLLDGRSEAQLSKQVALLLLFGFLLFFWCLDCKRFKLVTIRCGKTMWKKPLSYFSKCSAQRVPQPSVALRACESIELQLPPSSQPGRFPLVASEYSYLSAPADPVAAPVLTTSSPSAQFSPLDLASVDRHDIKSDRHLSRYRRHRSNCQRIHSKRHTVSHSPCSPMCMAMRSQNELDVNCNDFFPY